MQFTDTFPYFNYRSQETVLPILFFLTIFIYFASFIWLKVKDNSKNKKDYKNNQIFAITTPDNFVLPQTIRDKEVEPEEKTVGEYICFVVKYSICYVIGMLVWNELFDAIFPEP